MTDEQATGAAFIAFLFAVAVGLIVHHWLDFQFSFGIAILAFLGIALLL